MRSTKKYDDPLAKSSVLDVKSKTVLRQVDQRRLVAGGRLVPAGKIRWKSEDDQGSNRAGGGAGWDGDVLKYKYLTGGCGLWVRYLGKMH